MFALFSNTNSASGIKFLKVLRQFSSQTLKASTELASKTKSENLRKNVVEYRHIYPEFLPDPKVEFRNVLREKLERSDMIARRTQIDIPEFYVGSILAVLSSDPHSPGKPQRFVGICIKREGCGLRAKFILRNVIDHQVCNGIARGEQFSVAAGVHGTSSHIASCMYQNNVTSAAAVSHLFIGYTFQINIMSTLYIILADNSVIIISGKNEDDIVENFNMTLLVLNTQYLDKG